MAHQEATIKMAVRKVLQATDPQGEAVLRRRSNKVKVFDPALQRLADDMIETMHAHNGVGLAAPQVGVLQRIVIVELSAEKGEDEDAPRRPGQRFIFCNPEITWQAEELQVGEEGCLSLAGWYAQVPRALGVEVRYQDLQGKRRKMRVEGYLARILQHELDHLEGILFTDQIEDLATLVRLTQDGEEPVPAGLVPPSRRT